MQTILGLPLWFIFQQLQDFFVILGAILAPRNRLHLPGVFTIKISWEEYPRISFLQINAAGAKVHCNLCNNVWQSESLTSPFPASRPFTDLALKFRKASLHPEHCSYIDPCTKTALPLLQPSTSTRLCNPQISMSHVSKNVYILLIR